MISHHKGTLKSLPILLLIFTLGFSSLIIIQRGFINLTTTLDQELANDETRNIMGDYITIHLNSIEAQFYQIALSENHKLAEIIKNDIDYSVDHLQENLKVLESGGTFNHYIELNMVEQSKVIESIPYTPHNNESYAIENIDLSPKLEELKFKLQNLMLLIKKLESSTEMDQKEELRQEINFFVKQISPFFIRMKENANRLRYMGRKQVETHREEIKNKKVLYGTLQLIISLLMLIIVLIFGFIILKQILRINEKQTSLVKEAEQANIAKSVFLANMSHEIRTPLNAIIGFSDILTESILPQKEKEYANIVTRSAKTLLNIINDILDISKIENNKLELESVKFNLDTLFSEVIELYSVKAEEKKIHIFFNQNNDENLWLSGDMFRIKQVLGNLLSNAIKFTPEKGTVELAVLIQQKQKEKIKLKFYVKDTGIGISPEVQKHIFEPFSQADAGISRSFGGTGLGPSLCKSVLSAMDSVLELKSEEGTGSVFSFELVLGRTENTEQIIDKDLLNMTFGFYGDDSSNSHIKEKLTYYLEKYGKIIETPVEKHCTSHLVFCFNGSDLVSVVKRIRSHCQHCPVIYVGNTKRLTAEEKLLLTDNISTPLSSSEIYHLIIKYFNANPNALSTHLIRRYKGRILVAEDDDTNRKLIGILLEQLGISVNYASNGSEALKEIKTHDFSLIFMDINMPVMNGVSAVLKIRQSEKEQSKKQVPVIALTANVIPADKQHYLDSGMNGILPKPIQNHNLKEILDTYIDYTEVESQLNTIDIKKTTENICTLPDNSAHTDHYNPPKPETETGEVYNKESVMEKLDLDSLTMDMLLENFFLGLWPDLEKLQDKIDKNDRTGIAEVAHYIKGAAANLGFRYAEEFLENIVQLAKSPTEKTMDMKPLTDYFKMTASRVLEPS